MAKRAVAHKTLGKRIRTTMVFVGVCAVAFFAAYSVWMIMGRSHMFIVKSIVIKNNVKVNSNDVLALSGINVGSRMQDCNVRAAKKAIESLPWVRNVHVSRYYPSTIRITIEERVPVAILASGSVRFLDNEGVLLPFATDAPAELPVVTGLNPAASGNRIDTADMCRLMSVLNDASLVAPELLKQISQIDLSNESLVRIKLANSETLIELGSSTQRIGLMRLGKLLDIVSQTSRSEPQKLNLSFCNMAYAQW